MKRLPVDLGKILKKLRTKLFDKFEKKIQIDKIIKQLRTLMIKSKSLKLLKVN